MKRPGTATEYTLPDHPQRPLLGVLLVVLATLAFAASDAITKHLASSYPVPVIMAVRYVVNLVLLVLILLPAQGRRLVKTGRFGLQAARALCLAAGSLTLGWALGLMPVGEAIAIIYLAPFVVLLLSMPVLGERVGAIGWLGAAVGFAGVLLIVRPGGSLDPLGVAFAVANAVASTGYHLLTRLLGRTETTMSMLFHTAWIGMVVFCVLAVPALDGFAPTPLDFGLMVALGALMAIGHYLFTVAYRAAPPSLLGPVNYLHLIWAAGLGWLIFDHLPEGWSLLGMALVVLAGAGVAIASQVQHRRAAAAAPLPAD